MTMFKCAFCSQRWRHLPVFSSSKSLHVLHVPSVLQGSWVCLYSQCVYHPVMLGIVMGLLRRSVAFRPCSDFVLQRWLNFEWEGNMITRSKYFGCLSPFALQDTWPNVCARTVTSNSRLSSKTSVSVPDYPFSTRYHLTVLSSHLSSRCIINFSLLILSDCRSPWPSGLRRGHSLAGIEGSNPAGGMDVSLFWVLHVVR